MKLISISKDRAINVDQVTMIEKVDDFTTRIYFGETLHDEPLDFDMFLSLVRAVSASSSGGVEAKLDQLINLSRVPTP